MDGGPPGGDHSATAVSPSTREFLARLADARVIRHLQTYLLPGCCQTAGYTESLLREGWQADGAMLAAAHDARRIYRGATSHCDVRLLIDLEAVRPRFGGPEVHRDQVAELVRLVDEQVVGLRLLRSDAGAHPEVRGSFIHAEGSGGRVWAYREHDDHHWLIDDPRVATDLVQRFDDAWPHAIAGSELLDRLRQMG